MLQHAGPAQYSLMPTARRIAGMQIVKERPPVIERAAIPAPVSIKASNVHDPVDGMIDVAIGCACRQTAVPSRWWARSLSSLTSFRSSASAALPKFSSLYKLQKQIDG